MKHSSKIINEKDFWLIQDKPIGEGAFGKVFLVEDADQNKYAMKKLKDSDSNQILREIDILCRLDHPTIIGLRGYCISGQDLEDFTVLTEYMPNGNLSELIKKTFQEEEDLSLSENDCLRLDITKLMIIVYGIAKGMEVMHNHNILHRDLKPENILINSNYEPCITDFGLSKVTDTSNCFLQSTVAGTPKYASPEVKNGGLVNGLSDVFSFGLVVYFIFSGEDPKDDFVDHIDDLISEFPDTIQALISGCCSIDPEYRKPFDVITECLKCPECFVEGIDPDEFLEYVNRVDNYESKNDFYNCLELSDSSKLPIIFSANIDPFNINNNVSNGLRYFDIIEQISPEQSIIKENDEKNYLLSVYNSIDEAKLIDKINEYSKLNHPLIPQLKGIALSNIQNPTFIIKDVDYNGTLDSVIKQEYNESPSIVLDMTKKMEILYGISKAIEYLHSQGIILHELNPCNIYMDKDLKPYIMKIENDLLIDNEDDLMINVSTPSNQLCMPPEVMKDVELNDKSNAYSFSIITLFVLTGKYPSQDKMLIEKVKKFEDNKAVLLETIPKELHELIRSCFSKEPQDRPSFIDISEKLKKISQNVEGVNASEFNQYADFIHQKEEAVRTNNCYCVYDLGEMLQKDLKRTSSELINAGITIEQNSPSAEDIDKAILYYTRAAEKGDLYGNYHLGLIYKDGKGGVQRSLALAKFNLSIASKSEDEELHNLASSELNIVREEIKKNPYDNIKKRAKEGDAEAMTEYAWILFHNKGVKNNITLSIKYIKDAAEKGFPRAMHFYATMLKKGTHLNRNIPEAAAYFKRAADAGYTSSMYNYALMVRRKEISVANKEEEEAKYFKMAADNGDVRSMFCYAVMLNRRNKIKEAIEYYKKAIDKGHAKSMFNYAILLNSGIDGKRDKAKSLEYIKKAADLNLPEAMLAYAQLIEASDVKEALWYYKRCAFKGDKNAKEAYNRLKKK